MEATSLISATPKPPSTASFSSRTSSLYGGEHVVLQVSGERKKRRSQNRKCVLIVRGERNSSGGDVVENGGDRDGGSGSGSGRGYSVSGMEVTTFNQSFASDAEYPVWEKIGAFVRLGYGMGHSR